MRLNIKGIPSTRVIHVNTENSASCNSTVKICMKNRLRIICKIPSQILRVTRGVKEKPVFFLTFSWHFYSSLFWLHIYNSGRNVKKYIYTCFYANRKGNVPENSPQNLRVSMFTYLRALMEYPNHMYTVFHTNFDS